MGIFIDTGIFVAARNKSDIAHDKAKILLHQIASGQHGAYYTSDYIFDEAVTVAQVRTKSHEMARDIGSFILDMPNLKIQFVDEGLLKEAWDIHEQYADRMLSFTDCSSIARCRRFKISTICTTDAHFNGIIDKVLFP